MRPIDADALKEQLEDWLKLIQGYTSDEHEITRDVLLSVIHSYIADTPTLDAAPVRRGEWVDNGTPESMLSGCSVCGFPCGAYTFNFCPKCGADMREVRADDV